jgi:hypothetical protein
MSYPSLQDNLRFFIGTKLREEWKYTLTYRKIIAIFMGFMCKLRNYPEGKNIIYFVEIGMLAMLEGSFILTELTCLETDLNLNSVIVLSALIIL